jgi:hypothetical protein
MSITSPTAKANEAANKLKRRASSSSELTSVSEGEDGPADTQGRDGGQVGKPAKRAKLDASGKHKEKGVYCHQ